MVAKSSTLDNQLLALIFNGTTAATLFQNVTSGALTNLYMSLHTASPAAGGSQTTNEAAYPGYARVAVARNSGGFTVSGSSVTLTAACTFPTATGSPSETETYAAVGTASSGAGQILYFGPLNSSIVVNAAGITPQLTTGTTITES